MLDCTIKVKKNKKPVKGAIVQVTHKGENHNVFGKTDINGEVKIQVFAGLYEVKIVNGDDVYQDKHSLYTGIPLTIKFK